MIKAGAFNIYAFFVPSDVDKSRICNMDIIQNPKSIDNTMFSANGN